jgi:hypothetical protein
MTALARSSRNLPDPSGAENLLSSTASVQTDSRAHSTSYLMSTGVSSQNVKRTECEADHSPPSSVEVKNALNYISTPTNSFMAWCSIKHKDNFTSFYLSLSVASSIQLQLQIGRVTIEHK